MHYRVRGNSVQIVRTSTDRATGKKKSTPAGSMNLANGKLNDLANSSLNAAEKKEALTWLDARRALEEQRTALVLHDLPEVLSIVSAHVSKNRSAVPSDLIESIEEGVRKLKRAINS